MTLPVLYKYTTTGKIQEWKIVVAEDTFYTIEGIQGGKLTTSLPTKCYGKNIGKSNETTSKEQAILEAKAKWQKKVDAGYNEVLSRKKSFLEPMLAHEVKKYQKLLFTVPTFIQPKLDGLRCISQDNTLMSRNGKPYLACPHLYQNSYIFDGELYNHELHDNFNKIVSLCKKQDPSDDELKESSKIVEFWAYDFPEYIGSFSERYNALKKALEFKLGYKLVPTFKVNNLKEVEKYHDKFLEDGFEGSIIRLDLGNYEGKRSKQLLKKKDFIDEEFEIVDYKEGEGGRTGTIGKFYMRLDKSKPYLVDKENDRKCKNVFKSNIKGDFDFLKKVWKDRDSYIGTEATVKYFNRTPIILSPAMKALGYSEGNVPRFPYIIKLNRKEYE